MEIKTLNPEGGFRNNKTRKEKIGKSDLVKDFTSVCFGTPL